MKALNPIGMFFQEQILEAMLLMKNDNLFSFIQKKLHFLLIKWDELFNYIFIIKIYILLLKFQKKFILIYKNKFLYFKNQSLISIKIKN